MNQASFFPLPSKKKKKKKTPDRRLIQNVIYLHSSVEFPLNPLPLLRSCVPVTSEKDNGDEPYYKYPVLLICNRKFSFSRFFHMESHVANRVAVGYLKVYSGPMVPLNEKVQERSITVEKFVFSSLDTMHAKRMQNTCFAGTHPLILGQFPDPALVPFVLLHKTGILLIPDVLSNGLNFASLHGPLISLCGFKNSIT